MRLDFHTHGKLAKKLPFSTAYTDWLFGEARRAGLDALCLTEIDAEAPQADAWFPPVDRNVWQEKSRDARPADEKHPCPYAFVDYVRR